MSDETNAVATEAPNAAPDMAPEQSNETPAEARERRRIVARELADDDEIVLDVDGEERVIKARDWRRNTQRSESADKRFREASERARIAEEKERAAYAQAEALRRDLTDPRRFREAAYQLGLNPRQLAEQLIQIEAEEAQLTPEQRKLREYERMFAEQQEQQQRAQAEQHEQQVQTRMRQLHNRFEQVMTKAGIPQDAHRTRRAMLTEMARFAQETQQHEGRPPTIGEVIAEIHGLLEESGSVYAKRQTAPVAQTRPQTVPTAPKPATPQANQPRNANGQFASSNNGPRTVNDIFSLYGR